MDQSDRKNLSAFLDPTILTPIEQQQDMPMPPGALTTYQELLDIAHRDKESTTMYLQVVKDMELEDGNFLRTNYVPELPDVWSKIYYLSGSCVTEPCRRVFTAWVGLLSLNDLPHSITIWVEHPDNPLIVIPIWHDLCEINEDSDRRLLNVWLFESREDPELN